MPHKHRRPFPFWWTDHFKSLDLGNLENLAFWIWQHLYLLEWILDISDQSSQWPEQGLSDLPEHSEVLRSTSVTGMHPGKATHTGMSTLPCSPKQCSKVSSSTSSHGDLCLCPYSCILAQYYNMGNCIFCSFWQCLVSSCFLILAFSLSTKQT